MVSLTTAGPTDTKNREIVFPMTKMPSWCNLTRRYSAIVERKQQQGKLQRSSFNLNLSYLNGNVLTGYSTFNNFFRDKMAQIDGAETQKSR